MRSVTLDFQSGRIDVVEVPTPTVGARSLLVANHHSLISAGTEGYVIGMARKGPIGKALDRPDLAKQVIVKALSEGVFSTAKVVRNLISTPLPLGYSSAGVVIEAGANTDPFRPGDRVACAGLSQANHADHVVVPATMACKLPPNVATEDACFGTLGAIALHAVRLAQPEIRETFVVIGLGLLGQLCVQILKAAGCRVVGFDLDAAKVQLALLHGLDAGGAVDRDSAKEIVLGHTGGHGADGVLIAAHSASNDPVVMAGELSRERGRVIALGLVNLDIPRRIFFEKEIRLEVSRAYGPGAYDPEYERKGHDYPFGYVRWTQGRNLSAFIDLLAERKVAVQPLITHRFTLDQVTDAYQVALGERSEPHLGIVFQYDAPPARTSTIALRDSAGTSHQPASLNFGVIGTGRWAQAILLPALVGHPGVRVSAVASAHGLTARHVAEKYRCDTCSSDYRDVINRPDIGSVIIATRHSSHAEIVSAAMEAGKNVFVEKPLAITESQLDALIAAREHYPGTLMVGFNRRFAPLTRAFAVRLEGRRQPLALTFRFIVPRITKGHESEWVHDPSSGGSRIIGEMCHMVDTCSYLVGAPVATVYARSIGGDADAIHTYDTLHVTLSYRDGSIAALSYLANSDASVPQERVEMYWEGAYGLIDNFKSSAFSRGRKRSRTFGLSQKKGWSEEIEAFIRALRQGGTEPIPFSSLVETTRVTFAIERSLQTGGEVQLT
jgi:predicted dehydrogenase/threonine dehydrogenase-like Zn-dependent dehydrogenase